MINKVIVVIIFVLIIVFTVIVQKTKELFLQNDPYVLRLKLKLLPVFPEINSVTVLKGNKSYTINKHKIFICTSNKKGVVYDDNMLTYVFLHELAHCLNTDEIGHGKRFQNIFYSLLNRAEIYNLYDPNIPHVQNYCSD